MPIWMILAQPCVAWYTHFRRSQKPDYGAAPCGVVRLDGQPLRHARVTFYLVAGAKLRPYIAVDSDDAGQYEVYGLPLRTFRVTIADATVPAPYGDPRRTPLVFTGSQVGPIAQDLELESSARQ